MPCPGTRRTCGACGVGQQVAPSDAATESSGVAVGVGLPGFFVVVGVGVGDTDVLELALGCFRAFLTSARILAKSGFPGWTTSEVSGSDRIEPPFWMRSASSTQADS